VNTKHLESFVALFESVSVADAQARLQDLVAEEKALRALLRSLKVRERMMPRQAAKAKEVPHE
jgi:hypothetical protein